MSKKNGYYIPLPEDFLDNPKTQRVIARYGLGAVTIAHDLQTRMRDYESESETSFMIPMDDLFFLCRRYGMKEEELEEMVKYFYLIDLVKFYEISDDEGNKARYFYFEDLLENHLDWVEKRKHMAEIGRRGGQRRRLNSKYNEEENQAEGETEDER